MLFSVKKPKKYHWRFIPVLIVVIVTIGFIAFSDNFSNDTKGQGKIILENALNRSITQCYALEGMYPPDLEYIQTNYGLMYNPDLYFIDYQYIGSNLRPDVTIIERN